MPRTVNKIMPGIKKLWKGECSKRNRGIPNNFPDGEAISTPPPKIAPDPSRANKSKSTFLELKTFIAFPAF
jgi:hypothetical protein